MEKKYNLGLIKKNKMYFILILSNFLKNKIILNFYQKKNIILNIKFLSKKELL